MGTPTPKGNTNTKTNKKHNSLGSRNLNTVGGWEGAESQVNVYVEPYEERGSADFLEGRARLGEGRAHTEKCKALKDLQAALESERAISPNTERLGQTVPSRERREGGRLSPPLETKRTPINVKPQTEKGRLSSGESSLHGLKNGKKGCSVKPRPGPGLGGTQVR